MGEFKVKGALKETAEDVEVVIQASSYKEAERAANKMGILVSDVLVVEERHVEPQKQEPSPRLTYEQNPSTSGSASTQNLLVVRSDFNGLGLASMVIGIVTLIVCWIPVVNCFSFVLAGVGGLLGIIGLFRAGKGKGYSIVGIILNIISMAMPLFMYFVVPMVAMPALSDALDNVKHEAAQSKADAIAQQVTMYHLALGLYEIQDDFDLEVLLLSEAEGGAPDGPFLQKAGDILDPWGRPYEILVPGDVNHDFDIVSWGKDGEPGGEGANADITQ